MKEERGEITKAPSLCDQTGSLFLYKEFDEFKLLWFWIYSPTTITQRFRSFSVNGCTVSP